MKGTASVKLRPLKFAFLVNPADSKSLIRALELNASLWGGSHNPIIPTFQRIPAVWRKKGDVFGHTSKTILKGYIDAFNPDFLVPLGDCKKIKLDQFAQEVVDVKDLVVSIEDVVVVGVVPPHPSAGSPAACSVRGGSQQKFSFSFQKTQRFRRFLGYPLTKKQSWCKIKANELNSKSR